MNFIPSSSTAIHCLSRRQLIQYKPMGIGSSLVASSANSNRQLTVRSQFYQVIFITNWIAQTEHGEYYQAINCYWNLSRPQLRFHHENG